MKTFLVTVSSLCLCGILLCFWAYATDRLPGVSVAAMPQTTIEADPLCSPCVEKMTSILEIMESEWEVDLTAFLEQPTTPLVPAGSGWNRLSPSQREQAKQLFDQHGTEEGLRRLRESDPEAARQFERERRPVPSRDVPDKGQSESGSKD